MPRAFPLLLVFAGGAAGTLLRVGALALPLGLSEPVTMLAINVLGAFALGVVAGGLSSSRLRLLLGTGMLGGFTSYSAMIVLAGPSGSEWPMGLALAGATVVLGTLAAMLGLRLARQDPAEAPPAGGRA